MGEYEFSSVNLNESTSFYIRVHTLAKDGDNDILHLEDKEGSPHWTDTATVDCGSNATCYINDTIGGSSVQFERVYQVAVNAYDFLKGYTDNTKDLDGDGQSGDVWNQPIVTLNYPVSFTVAGSSVNIFLPTKDSSVVHRLYHLFFELGFFKTDAYPGNIEENNNIMLEPRATNDTVQHEYSHGVMYKLYGTVWDQYFMALCNPFSVHSWDTISNPYCAFSEGFAGFMPKLIHRSALLRSDQEIENQTTLISQYRTTGKAQEVEGIVAGILYDISDNESFYDGSAGTDDDLIQDEFGKVWQILRDERPKHIGDFFKKWMEQGSEYTRYKNALSEIYCKHGVDSRIDDYPNEVVEGYRPVGPYNDWTSFHHDNTRAGYSSLCADFTSGSSVVERYTFNESANATEFRDSPVTADIDNDGTDEIIVAAYGIGSSSVGGGLIYAIDRDNGTWVRKWRFPEDGTRIAGIYAAPAVGDVDNDGTLEVAFSTIDGEVYLLNAHTGEPKWPTPYVSLESDIGSGVMQQGIVFSVSMEDMDGDDDLELVFADAYPYTAFDSKLYAIRYDKSELWIRDIATYGPEGTLAFGDVLNHTGTEVLIPNYLGIRLKNATGHSVNIYNSSGHVQFEWGRSSFDRLLYNTPVIADLDGDRVMETIETASGFCPPSTNCSGIIRYENRTFIRYGVNGSIRYQYNHTRYPEMDSAVGKIEVMQL